MNRVILSGQVCNNPTKFIVNSSQVVRFRLVTTSKWTTEYHNIAVWGKSETVDSIKEGAGVIMCGEIRYRSYTDKQGVLKGITEIVVNIGSGDSIELFTMEGNTTDLIKEDNLALYQKNNHPFIKTPKYAPDEEESSNNNVASNNTIKKNDLAVVLPPEDKKVALKVLQKKKVDNNNKKSKISADIVRNVK